MVMNNTEIYLNTSGRITAFGLCVVGQLEIPGAWKGVHQVRLLPDHSVENILARNFQLGLVHNCRHDLGYF